ncbi:hypothetical protein QBC44DRAFT_307733 [Cladorrhinum sp. PSN332]|nr:hypothetical protein QBC44DRAFT_307733 [Cladorrhinum sp. PSN332]
MCYTLLRHYSCNETTKHTKEYRLPCTINPTYHDDRERGPRDYECERIKMQQVHQWFESGIICPDCSGEMDEPGFEPRITHEMPWRLTPEQEIIEDDINQQYRIDVFSLLRVFFTNYVRSQPTNVTNPYIEDPATGARTFEAITNIIAECSANLVCPISPDHGMAVTLQYWGSGEWMFAPVRDFGIDCNHIPSTQPALANPARFIRQKIARRVMRTVVDPNYFENVVDGVDRLAHDDLAVIRVMQNAVLKQWTDWADQMKMPKPEGAGKSTRDIHLKYLPALKPDMAGAHNRFHKIKGWAVARLQRHFAKNSPDRDVAEKINRRFAIIDWFALIMAMDTGLTEPRLLTIIVGVVDDFVLEHPELYDEYYAALPGEFSIRRPAAELYHTMTVSDLREWTERKIRRAWDVIPHKVSHRWNKYYVANYRRSSLVRRNIKLPDRGKADSLFREGRACSICSETLAGHESVAYNGLPCTSRICLENERDACWYSPACVVRFGRGTYDYTNDPPEPRCPMDRAEFVDQPEYVHPPNVITAYDYESDDGFVTSPEADRFYEPR